MRTSMCTRCSVALVAISVSGCGNFLGTVGEEMGRGNPSKREREKERLPLVMIDLGSGGTGHAGVATVLQRAERVTASM
jgi:hypothetical protein